MDVGCTETALPAVCRIATRTDVKWIIVYNFIDNRFKAVLQDMTIQVCVITLVCHTGLHVRHYVTLIIKIIINRGTSFTKSSSSYYLNGS